MTEHKRNKKIRKRIMKMTPAQYAWHYLDEGDDRKMSMNIFLLIYLARQWFMGLISPREEEELGNRLYYIRQRLFFRDNKNKKPSPPATKSITFAFGTKVITYPATWDVIDFDIPMKSMHVGVVEVRGKYASSINTFIFFSKRQIKNLTVYDIDTVLSFCNTISPDIYKACQCNPHDVGVFEIVEGIDYGIPVRIDNAKM